MPTNQSEISTNLIRVRERIMRAGAGETPSATRFGRTTGQAAFPIPLSRLSR